jgi:hemolysin III
MKSLDVRAQTVGEEIANTAIHAAALVLLPAMALLTWPAPRAGSGRLVTPAIAVYLLTMVLLYATSAVYHGLPPGRYKRLFMKLDYCVIYLFIAGSYTPFAVGVLAAHGGIALLIAVWTLAGGGVALQLFGKLSHPLLSTGFYLGMGWAVLVVARPLFTLLPLPGAAWLLAGGLCYTGGVVFFLLDSRLRFGHSMWHLAVLAGSSCHLVAIARYV